MLPEIDATGCSATGAVSADKGDTISISPNGTHDVDEAKAVNTVIRLAKEIAGNLPLKIIPEGLPSAVALLPFAFDKALKVGGRRRARASASSWARRSTRSPLTLLRLAWPVSWRALCTLTLGKNVTIARSWTPPVDGIGYTAGALRATLGAMKVIFGAARRRA